MLSATTAPSRCATTRKEGDLDDQQSRRIDLLAFFTVQQSEQVPARAGIAFTRVESGEMDAGVDEAVSRGYVDESNLFVYGCSGGGVLSRRYK